MKHCLALLYILVARPALAQQPQFTVHNLPLPRELSSADNQFSGLSISAGKLFLLSESRLQDNAEAKLYTVQLKDLERQLADSTYVLPYQKLPLINLPALRTKINAAGQRYEGLEALLIDRGVVYLSVENDTHSPNGYLLRGALSSNAVVLDTTFLVPLAKPVAADGAPIYNAGFEALAASRRRLFGFFEFNYFSGENCAYEFTKKRLPAVRPPRKRRVERVPFRLTDITAVGRHRFTAINYFFQGGGEDAVYRTPAGDLASTQLIQDRGTYRSYARLLTMEWKGQKFTWRPLWEFPESYRGYNWEGLAAYHGGYFVINDKYTPQRPFRTTLLYLKRVP